MNFDLTATSWNIFRKKCVSNGASEEQLHDLKVAFYGGCKSTLMAVKGAADLSEDLGCVFLGHLEAEINGFFEQLKKEGSDVP
jgi:hypothetical protein